MHKCQEHSFLITIKNKHIFDESNIFGTKKFTNFFGSNLRVYNRSKAQRIENSCAQKTLVFLRFEVLNPSWNKNIANFDVSEILLHFWARSRTGVLDAKKCRGISCTQNVNILLCCIKVQYTLYTIKKNKIFICRNNY